MKSIVCLFIFTISLFVVKGGDVHPQHNPNQPSTCRYYVGGSNYYDLSALRKSHGKPYYHKDTDGDEWFFNVCGDLSSLEVTNCPKNATVCKRTNNVGLNAGKRAEWSQLPTYITGNGVEITYGDGDSCSNGETKLKTTMEFVCENGPQVFVRYVNHVDNCYAVITVASSEACQQSHVPSVPSAVGVSVRIPSFYILMLALLSFTICCVCICACCARGKRNKYLKKMREENEMIQFSNVAFDQIPQNIPNISLERMEPQAPNFPTELPMQYLQAPQFFLYPMQNSVFQPPSQEER